MSQYYFALTNPEAENLLKEEIKLSYPEFRMSYSRPGFLTFKGGDGIPFRPVFARVSGRSLGKLRRDELIFPKAWVWALNDKVSIPAELQEISDRSLFKVGETVTLIMVLGSDEFWVGQYELQPSHFQTPGEVSSIELLEDVPSRAYYKIAEAFEAFDITVEHEERVLELGSAPGGASMFLLEQDLKVLGVDPAEMDKRVKGAFNFKHLKMPFENLTSGIVGEIDWIVSDINLPPTVVMKELRRLLSFTSPRGVILTLKFNQTKHLPMLSHLPREFKELGFTHGEIKFLPSHRQEVCLFAIKE